MIRHISDRTEKMILSREILQSLPEWFGIPEATELYISESGQQQFFAAVEKGKTVGFLCLKQTGKDTAELAVMGVLKEYHRRGVGRELFQTAKDYAKQEGYSFIQVKTVQMGRYPDYDDTNRFYLSLGFQEFEVFPTLWGERNPCQVYVMSLR